MKSVKILSFGCLAALTVSAAHAQQSTTYEKGPDGVTYQVTRNVVQKSMPSTEYQSQQQTVYHPQAAIDYQTYQQNYAVPVTQYQWVTRMHEWWNVFDGPYYTQELQPITRWETRAGTVQVPVTRTDWVQENRTTQVPVTTYKTVNEEYTSRVAVSASPSFAPAGIAPAQTQTSVAMQPTYGGQQLQSDPPRAPSTSYR
jgi:hypothetical protein